MSKILHQSGMHTTKPRQPAPSSISRMFKDESWRYSGNATPAKDLDDFHRSSDTRNRPVLKNTAATAPQEALHASMQRSQASHNEGLPRIPSVPSSSALGNSMMNQAPLPMNHSVSQDFEARLMNSSAKRPSKKQARRLKFVSKNQKIIDNRMFMQQLAMNYYGARPDNYLALDGKSHGSKKHQIMTILHRRSVNQGKSAAK